MKEKGNTVLVVDGGGRGSVLVDKYAQSNADRILAVPGNDLMQDNTNKPVQIFPELKTTDASEIVELCEKEHVDLVDIGQDNAVRAGLADILTRKGIAVVGPTKKAGQIEWDKAWARQFGKLHDLPQPSFDIFTSEKEAVEFLSRQTSQPRFIKPAFLNEGKGSEGAKTNTETIEKIRQLRKRFPDASNTFLIEEWMMGKGGVPSEEFSSFIISDGQNYKIIGNVQDYKREKDNDEGENTGSMGSNSSPLLLTPKLMEQIDNIFGKTITALNQQGRSYKGVLYLGGMVVDGQVKIVEFNARWGDPEAQVILPGIKNDWFDTGMAIANGDISDIEIKHDNKVRVVVAGAALGYPRREDYERVLGKEIFGIKEARQINGVKVYGAAVKRVDSRDYAAGGRLFYIVGEGKDVIEAQERAYEAMLLVSVDGNNLHYRMDIGWRDRQRLLALRS